MSTTPTLEYRQAARALLRDTLFDAARRLLEQDRPWAQISMAEVAAAAGVSRQTLYAQFGSRDEFAQQFVIREGARFLDEVESAIHAHLDDPTEALRAGLRTFLRSAAEDPLVGLLLSDDGTGGMLPLVTTRSRPVLAWACARLTEAIGAGWEVDEDDAAALADTFVRLALSYATLPPPGDPAETAADAARQLGPYLERALSAR